MSGQLVALEGAWFKVTASNGSPQELLSWAPWVLYAKQRSLKGYVYGRVSSWCADETDAASMWVKLDVVPHRSKAKVLQEHSHVSTVVPEVDIVRVSPMVQLTKGKLPGRKRARSK